MSYCRYVAANNSSNKAFTILEFRGFRLNSTMKNHFRTERDFGLVFSYNIPLSSSTEITSAELLRFTSLAVLVFFVLCTALEIFNKFRGYHSSIFDEKTG